MDVLAALPGFQVSLQGFLAALQGFLTALQSFLAALQGFLAALQGFLAALPGFLAALQGFLAAQQSFLAALHGFLSALVVRLDRILEKTTYDRRIRHQEIACLITELTYNPLMVHCTVYNIRRRRIIRNILFTL
jgi:ABC-type transporter Mla subunit MlaD